MIYNFSNIKSGGGIQVSLSFLNYLSKLNSKHKDTIVVSIKLNTLITKSKINLSDFNVIVVKNFLHKFCILTFHKHDKIFTIFGPTYAFKKSNVKWINGFAQPWIIFPNNKVYLELNIFNRYFLKIKFKIQEFFYSKSDIFIVEHYKIKELLLKLFPKKKIFIAHNSINEIFKDEKKWKKIEVNSKKIKIGIIGKSYIHKNLKILPDVKKKLIDNFNLDTNFFVTLSDYEMRKMSKKFKENIKSVGEINITQCPSFYNQMDIIFFPSNLECFSATPIESLFMQKKIVCSNYFFNKYYNSNLIEYFEPNDSDDAAKKIFLHLKRDLKRDNKNHSDLLSEFNAEKRFKIIYKLIN